MESIIFNASVIAAFVAGMVALFAPCCVTVLLPAYLASAFGQRQQLVKMTLVFFAGISLVLVPIGLGAAGLAAIFQNFHREMYIFGGLLMLVLAVMAIAGKGLAMIPMSKRLKPGLKATSAKSVFVLGIFSGAATSCCAPVLAGAVTLAVISGAFWKALIVTFAYVFGLTFPLFILAYFYDKLKIAETKIIKGKLLELKFGAKSYYLHTTNLLAGIIFFFMGLMLLYLAFSGQAFWSPAWQASLGQSLNLWSQKATQTLTQVPEGIWAVIILAIFFFFAWQAKRKKAKGDHGQDDLKIN